MPEESVIQSTVPTTPVAAAAASIPYASAAGTVTATMTTTDTVESQAEVLRLTLRGRSNVRWDESVLDNEGLGRKSSKRCCIFHKQRQFGESSTDSSDEDDGASHGKRKIARPKKKVPDYQRYHA